MRRILRRLLLYLKEEGILAFIEGVVRRVGTIALLLLVDVFSHIATDDQLVLFGASYGRRYQGNSRAVFEWIVQHEPDISAVWMTQEDEIYQRLRDDGLPVAHSRSLRGLYLLTRAKAVVYTYYVNDITFLPRFPRSCVEIYLTHGVPPKYDSEFMQADDNRSVTGLNMFASGEVYYLTTSTFLAEARMEAGRYDEEVVVTGHPRNDNIVEPTDSMRTEWKRFLNGVVPNIDDCAEVTKVLYAPTVRQPQYIDETSTVEFFPFDDFDKERLFALLEDKNVLLFLKPHPGDVTRLYEDPETYDSRHADTLVTFLEELAEHEHVVFVPDGNGVTGNLPPISNHDIPSMNQMLPFINCLITDYSSVYHDYLLLNRPMLFIPYDLEAFDADFGFKYDYLNQMPGPNIETFESFLQSIAAVSQGENVGREDRLALQADIHRYTDAKSSRRVAEFIKGICTGCRRDTERAMLES